MKVISNKNSKKLVKGAVYEALKINNLKGINSGYFRPYIKIKINENTDSDFIVKNFTLEDGNPIPEINWESTTYKSIIDNISKTKISTINPPKIGEYVKYIGTSHKNLEYNNKYRISNIREEEVKSSYGINPRKVYDIQVEGSSRFYMSHYFIKCNTQEISEISINNIFDEDNSVKKIDKNSRKIDQYDLDTRERILTRLLIKSILDINRNNMSVVEWACKNESFFSVTKDDFNQILNKSLLSILEKYD